MSDEVEPLKDQDTPEQMQKQRRWLRSILLWLLMLIVLFVAALAVMFSTDKGSKFLLDRALSAQQIIKYEYEAGNLLQGIILKNVLVSLKTVDVKIDRADVSLGWRAIFDKEVHLSHADVKNLRIINKSPPSNEPFKFSTIKLPFILRVDKAEVDHLVIQTSTTQVNFDDVALKNGLWSGTELTFEDTKLDMGYLSVRDAKGRMDFEGKYPLNATGIVNLPSLESLNIKDIYLDARGSLDTIKAGVATNTPDLLTGWVVVHPVRDRVPMKGALNFKDYHWPLLVDQALLSKKGIAKFQGDIDRLNLDINTDISGKNIPEGQYTALAHTDLVNQLDISNLNGQLMKGAVNVSGVVSWQDFVHWDLKGRLDKISPEDKVIPQAIRDFLPPSLDGNIASTGDLKTGMTVNGSLDFDKYETWNVTLNQAEQKTKKPEPMLLDVSWKNIDRAMPYIGWLSSDQGEAKLTLIENQQDIQVATQVKQNEKGYLPEGHYEAKLDLKGNILNVPAFQYRAAKGGLNGSAVVELPDEKRQLKWNALLNAQDFNPQSITASAPINLLNGQVKANGYALPNQQIVVLDSINLTGRLANQAKSETVKLTGRSTAALLFHDEKSGGAFKSFGVNYDGHLQASQLPQGDGVLKLRVSGTPELINISELEHNGIAGRISARGLLNLSQGIGWDINASLVRFKPQYFVANVNGELSGNLQSKGLWSDQIKRINVSRLNLAGVINKKPLRAQGNLAVLINNDQKGFLPQQFEANNLFVSFAQNQLQATGNAQNLRLKINAPALYEIYPGLRGKAQGYINVQSRPRLSATANLNVYNFGFNNTFSIKKLSLQGELPTSDTVTSKMTASMDSLRSGGREIQFGELSISGTRKAHILYLRGWNYYSKFYVQLAGGFNAKNDWVGQIQHGLFDSVRAKLTQAQNAPVIFNRQKSEVYVGQHCWSSKQSKICFDQPIRASKTHGNISFLTQNLDLGDFQAFMPEGFAITGKLNGYAKASWANGTKPKLDARLVTRSGKLGISAENPDDVGSTMDYEEVSLIAKSVQEGLLMRLDLKAPNIGTGYANVVIDPYSDAKPMRGEVAFDKVQLKILKPFIADLRSIDGVLSVAGKVGGTLNKPSFNGNLRLRNGSVSMISLPVNLTNIELYSAINNDSGTIDGAFNSGAGVGKLKGKFEWKDEPHIFLDLKGDNLRIRQTPLIDAKLKIVDKNDEGITLDVWPNSKKLTVKGAIEVPEALISMPESTAAVVPLSADVRVVRAGDDQLALLKAAQPWDIRADVDVRLGTKVIFQGFNSKINLLGRVYLTQRGRETAMRANGIIGVAQRVKIEAYGQSLDLNRAIARFNGALSNPTLDVDANKSISGSIVGVRVTGTANNPNIDVYNDAGLSKQEAMNALVSGRINEGSSGLSNEQGFKSDVNNTIAAAGISLGLGGTRAFTNQIGQSFGLSGLALDAQGTGDDTQVSVTGYITPDLFLRYGVGVFTPVNKLTLRYQMNKRLYLEASQSLEKAIDVFYNWKF
ncbi:translocation/assembly module TamB domain-containing protein [Acinetobacter shaoyimingii]|uniref:Translocation and assembly module TamB C-terminal domain-containing protein n=1 Tax=Acinetobacter shaoyimingii TaxID=2715164 RepID=A0A6G8RW98_9GAMM|nr:translocation/assembly module TamB domain-containing protein [Acinetobacter shaoyimingii]NHB57173.1 hypothetical protein [Acinetobacter shaoyimingii]QIO06216.1 hypothetical protein G8E00_09730 [Acinetobacter shaoyimingii]